MKQLTAIFTAILFMSFSAAAQNPGTGVVSMVTSVSGCVSFTPAQSNGPDNWEVAEGGTYEVTITGVTECTDAVITVFVQNSGGQNWCFNATGGGGTYVGTATTPDPGCFTMPISYKCGADQSCDNANTYDANGPSGTGSVHFRNDIFDGDCNVTALDEDCDDDNNQPPSINCSALGQNYGCVTEAPTIPSGCYALPSVDGGCEPVVITHSPKVETIDGCVHIWTRTYTATDNCGQTASCSASWSYSIASPLVFDNLPSGGAISGCNPAAPSCDGNVTATNGCGTVSATCTAGDITSDGCNRSQTFSYHAETACGDPANADVTYTWTVSTDVTVEANGSTDICSGSCVQLNATPGFASYQWYFNGNAIDGETEESMSACEAGDYSVTATNSCNCESSSGTTTVTVYETPSCNLDPITDDNMPVANSNDNTLCAEVSGGSGNTYAWTLTSSDGSWTINPGTEDDLCVSYHCGTFGSTATFTFVVTSHYDNLNCSGESCTITISTEAHEQCSYTQGFYGQENGETSCTGVPAPMAVQQALNAGGPIILGNPSGTRRLTIGTTEAACVVTRLPGNGTAAVLPSKSPSGWSCGTAPNAYTNLQGTKFKSVLLGQTLTLAINTRLFPELLGYHLTTSTFTTYATTDCDPETDDVIPNSGITKTIPQSVINCLGTNSTTNKVSNLLALANKALGGQPYGCASGAPTLAEINLAVAAVNEGFDKCRIISGYNIRMASVGTSELGLIAYPNPTSGSASLEFVSVSATRAIVDVLDVNGSLIRQIFDTEVTEGSMNRVDFNTADWASGIYFIRLTLGDQTGFTRLVVLK